MTLFLRFALSIFLLMTLQNSLADQRYSSLENDQAEHCSNLLCVRNHIDAIDTQIVNLIGVRLTYVKRAGELKRGKQNIHDAAREKRILMHLSEYAQKEGFPPSIIQAVYITLLKETNTYERSMMSTHHNIIER